MRMWPQMMDHMFLLFSFKAISERLNTLQVNVDGSTPESILYVTEVDNIPVKTFHTTSPPVYVLDSRLQSAGGASPQKWEPHSRKGVYLGNSPFNAGSATLVFNRTIPCIIRL